MKKWLWLIFLVIWVVGILFDVVYITTHIELFEYLKFAFVLIGCLGICYTNIKNYIDRKK